jgi:uncharacterized protein (DUF2249 family)
MGSDFMDVQLTKNPITKTERLIRKSVVDQAMSSAASFELVLAGLKTYLEHGIELNLIADRFPDHIINRVKSNSPTNQRRNDYDQSG